MLPREREKKGAKELENLPQRNILCLLLRKYVTCLLSTAPKGKNKNTYLLFYHFQHTQQVVVLLACGVEKSDYTIFYQFSHRKMWHLNNVAHQLCCKYLTFVIFLRMFLSTRYKQKPKKNRIYKITNKKILFFLSFRPEIFSDSHNVE